MNSGSSGEYDYNLCIFLNSSILLDFQGIIFVYDTFILLLQIANERAMAKTLKNQLI